MTELYSTSSGWIIPITRTLQDNNIDYQQALLDCGLEGDNAADQESRVVIDKITQLLYYCSDRMTTNDAVMQVAKHFHPGIFHALGYAMLSSDTLHDAFNRIAQYKRVVSNTCSVEVEASGDELRFSMVLVNYEGTEEPVLKPVAVELFLSTITQIARSMISEHINPTRVEFDGRDNYTDTQAIEEFFQCPISHGHSLNSVYFDLEQANAKLFTGNPLITQAHEKMLDDFMSRVNKNDLSHVIKTMIYEALPLGAPSQAQIARDMGMSLRNLQRRLHEQGTNYKDILEQTRKKLAVDYLRQNHLTLSEVGYLLGFSSVGNFNRAFKRWTGDTPGEYRAKLSHNPSATNLQDMA